jgi:arylformamidase
MANPALTPEFVERGYNNRAAVADHPRWLALYTDWSARARAKLQPKLDLRYGPGPKETLDLFLPTRDPLGTFLFIHGGYWRMLDKSDFSLVATPFVAAGHAVAVANYDLCPAVTIAAIVDQCRRAVTWLIREGPAHGAATDRLVIGGHSAGGHLTAMLFASDWAALGHSRDPIVGGVSISGVHDLAPLVLSSYNTDLKLNATEAARQSPVHLQPRTTAPILLFAGAQETSEFVRQTQLLWDAWPDNRPANADAPTFIRDRHHFNVIVDYADPESELTRATLALF